MEASMVAKLLELGFPGVIILALALYALRKDKKVDEVNEKRIAEAREGITAIEQNTNALETLTQVLRDRSGAGR